ncbi:MAG: type III pantothenate kinase [Bacilli bacterium]|jgi:type III pantothenate kinase
MILTVDLGNTTIHLGIFEGSTLIKTWATNTDLFKEKSEYYSLFKRYFKEEGIDPSAFEGGILSSVVPPLTLIIKAIFTDYFSIPMMELSPGIKTGLPIHIDKPDELGADLVASAVGARAEFGFPLTIIDLGTANKVTVIDEKGNFIGAVFTPGLRVAVDALVKNTAQLPAISLQTPVKVIGKNTVDAMNSGATYGTMSEILGLVRLIEKELGYPTKRILLGGYAPYIKDLLQDEVIYAPHLQLKGLAHIYNRNKRGHRDEK